MNDAYRVVADPAERQTCDIGVEVEESLR